MKVCLTPERQEFITENLRVEKDLVEAVTAVETATRQSESAVTLRPDAPG